MVSKKVEQVLNEQIEKEAYSSSLYLSMASWAETKGFAGTSTWFYAQADEERMHMLKIVKYVNERGGHAVIPGLDKPPVDFSDIKTVFSKVMDHEQYITKSINDIVGVCMEEKDFTTHNWIQWFVNEQIEEEAQVNNLIDKLNLMGDGNLYFFDRDIMDIRSNSGSQATGA